MRCQQLRKKLGWGTTKCPRDAAPGDTLCTRCRDRETRKHANAVLVIIGKPGKNMGWRDPEFRRFVRQKGCILAGHPLHRCASVCERRRIEFCHYQCKGHAPDRLNGYGGCPALADELEGAGNAKVGEKKYTISLKQICLDLDLEYEESLGPVEAAR